MGGADLDAGSAADTEFGNDRGARIDDPDRLAVTVPDTLIAVLALIIYCKDGEIMIHFFSPLFSVPEPPEMPRIFLRLIIAITVRL